MDNADDLIVEALDKRPVARRRRRFRNATGACPDALPQEWRNLLERWIRRGGRSKWDTLTRDAGAANLQTSQALLDWLLRHGWATVEEQRRHGDWWPQWVELREVETLRAALGLPDESALTREWAALRASLWDLDQPALQPALGMLDDLPAMRALARGKLLAALSRWRDEQRSGTRRDFALFARGTTKAVSDAEWRWLEDSIDLGDFSIERHTPLLLLSAPLTLIAVAGRLDLAAAADFAAITPQTLAAATSANHNLARWRLVENRTSFERVARSREPDTGVIWLPGYPPTWWRDAISQLLALAPAPAEIACDPDPAGIEIACQAGSLWEAHALEWNPWRMSANELEALRHATPLNDHDREKLQSILQGKHPPELAALAHWMSEHNRKGEQEGFL
jgi:hypothetical protein